MKNTKIIISVVVVLLIGGISWWALNKESTSSTGSEQVPPGQFDQGKFDQSGFGQAQPETSDSQTVITYTNQGFSPASINIKKGDTVVWKNESLKDMWPASAMHPTHTIYPGSGITKCNTAEQPAIFDACAPVSPGSSWSFKFLQLGSWKFHDHLSTTNFGTVNVE